jgi:hypothetical protein
LSLLTLEKLAKVARKYFRNLAQIILCRSLEAPHLYQRTTARNTTYYVYYILDMANGDFELVYNLVGENGKSGVKNLDSL